MLFSYGSSYGSSRNSVLSWVWGMGFREDFWHGFSGLFDFLTNSIMMPLAALATCILIIRVVGFEKISKEIEISSAFRRKKLYIFFVKYLAVICIGIILVSSIANVLGIISL